MSEDDGNSEFPVISRSQVHDLKNRLTVVKGMTQLLGRYVQRAEWDRDRIVQRIEDLQIEIGRLEGMIDELRLVPPSESGAISIPDDGPSPGLPSNGGTGRTM